MRIMMFTLALHLSGQSVHIRNLAKGLISRGHQVIVAAGELAEDKSFGKQYFASVGAEVVQVPVAHLGHGLKNFVKESWREGRTLKAVLQRYRPDILHLHAVTLAAQAQVARTLMRRPPALITTFNNGPITSQKLKLGRWACAMKSTALGHRLIGVSKAITEEVIMGTLKASPRVARTISCSIDDGHFYPPSPQQRSAARQEFGVKDDELAVCCLARLDANKNQIRLIAAVGSLLRKGYRIKLLLAGDDIVGYADQLRLATEREDCPQAVSFLGFQDARQVLWASDVNVLVSIEEAFGLTVIEAAMASVPSIRSRSGGAEDQVIDGQTGLLVEATDVASIAAALERFIVDAQWRAAVAQRAAESAHSRYRLDLMAHEVETIYNEVTPA